MCQQPWILFGHSLLIMIWMKKNATLVPSRSVWKCCYMLHRQQQPNQVLFCVSWLYNAGELSSTRNLCHFGTLPIGLGPILHCPQSCDFFARKNDFLCSTAPVQRDIWSAARCESLLAALKCLQLLKQAFRLLSEISAISLSEIYRVTKPKSFTSVIQNRRLESPEIPIKDCHNNPKSRWKQ